MMIVLTWVTHCIFIAAFLTAAAFAWEVGARWSGRAARWGWLAALVGSVSAPWLLRLVPAQAVESLPVVVPLLVLDPVTVDAAVTSSGPSLATAGLIVWASASLLALLYVVSALLRLGAQRRGWREAEVEGGRVLLTNGVGPAVLGVRRPIVLLPTWALQLDAELRSLLLRHEREHVRAGDPRLLVGGLVLLAAMPWNPLVWLQVLRLRNAIELDCDARVLAGGADPERYGSLLLEVGRRRSSSALVMATFAEPRVFLEERIRRIARWPLERSPARAAMFALLGMALFATALSARDPLRAAAALPVMSAELLRAEPASSSRSTLPSDTRTPADTRGPSDMPRPSDTRGPSNMRASSDMRAPSDTPPAPTFTPMTVRPELQSRNEVAELLRANYPPLLRDAGIGGSPVVWFYINAEGTVDHVRISRTSGYPALDEAALAVAQQMRFSPAQNRGRPVPVWVEIPIVFTHGGVAPARQPSPEGATTPAPRPEVRPARPDDPAGGALRPSRRAELLNGEEVQRALQSEYPPLLRDAGIGGRIMVRVTVRETGVVDAVSLAQPSEHRALNEAALRVASIMRFRTTEAAQFDVPIVFSTQLRTPSAAGDPPPQRRSVVPPTVQPPDLPPTRSEQMVRIPQRMPVNENDVTRAPQFTPMTDRPELLNREEVARAMVRAYPPELRDAGIGGSPRIWFFIDETGIVRRTQLSQSSGYPVLDEAALSLAPAMRFKPALNRETPVAVWVEIPVSFTAR